MIYPKYLKMHFKFEGAGGNLKIDFNLPEHLLDLGLVPVNFKVASPSITFEVNPKYQTIFMEISLYRAGSYVANTFCKLVYQSSYNFRELARKYSDLQDLTRTQREILWEVPFNKILI